MFKALPAWFQALYVPRKYGIYSAMVSPRVIKYLRRSSEWPGYTKWWPLIVCGGEWDTGCTGQQPFREEQMREMFVDQIPYRETGCYKEMVAELKQYGCTSFPRCRSLDEIHRYFEGVYELYERIKTEGYRRRKGPEASHGEITVRIGRDGSFIKCGEGTHRHAIALLIGVPAVPVVVDLVHWRWALECARKRQIPLKHAIQQELDELSQQYEGHEITKF